MALALIAVAVAWQVANSPSLSGWRSSRVVDLTRAAFTPAPTAGGGQSPAPYPWKLLSPAFELDGRAPATLRAEFSSAAERATLREDQQVAVVDLRGRTMPLRSTTRRLFNTVTSTGFGSVELAGTGRVQEWQIVSSVEETGSEVVSGGYRLAYADWGASDGLPSVRFIVSQTRGYFLDLPLEYWLLGIAGVVGWLVLRRWERGRLEDPATAEVLPLALQIVAWLVIYAGVRAVVGMLVPGGNGVQFSLTVLAIWAGVDLLRLRSGWRTLVLIALWLGIIGCAVGAVALLVQDSTGSPSVGALYLCVALAALCFWQYRVLVRPEVRVLFETADAARRPDRSVPTGMLICRRCDELVPFGATVCPHCGKDPRPWEEVHAGELGEWP